jgi:hypothetical protein
VKFVKTGALIAFAAGGLFASACKKEDKPAGDPSTTPGNAVDPAKPDRPAATGEPSVTTPAKADTAAEPPAKADTAAEPPAKAEAAAEPPAEKLAKVDCYGVNACKGQGTCRTEKHGCGGQNECKGQGVLTMTEAECDAQRGTVTARY